MNQKKVTMELAEILYQQTNDTLKGLAGLCGCSGQTRKDDLVRCIHKAVMTPASLAQLWGRLDDVSKKAVASAYHNGGEFNATAFLAQYGSLPQRPQSKWSWTVKPILLDLFLHSPLPYYTRSVYNPILPSDLMPLLENLVPPPDKFRLEGRPDAPKTVMGRYRKTVELIRAETEQAGLHDLTAYLRLVHEGKISSDYSSGRATIAGIKQIMASLLQEDFLPLPPGEKYRANQTIRPFGLDVFARESGLAKVGTGSKVQLTPAGQRFYQTQDVEVLLEAFETWTREGRFDELSRISAIKGQKTRNTSLTPPASRREPIIEALSWCPVGVWIDLEEFFRAVKIWHFDFEVEKTPYSNLYVGDKEYGALYGEIYWPVVKGSYIKVVLWEYLGGIGALDLLYTYPEDARSRVSSPFSDEIFSLYDGLSYFRINPLGAYLLGQAGEYIPSKPLHQPLFTISADLAVTLANPAELTPNQRSILEQLAISKGNGHYRLDTQRLLTSLEEGQSLDHLVDFLQKQHTGPLPPNVSVWLEQIQENSQAFKRGEPALFIKAKSADLAQLALADPVLQKYCSLIDKRTLVIPASKEKAVRARLKELEYLLQ
ncbi:MAG: hypothetical protein KJ077_26925 [Anaerolineae bacterium]|nr:hypothetical protein [Anaerolineae bacterium]